MGMMPKPAAIVEAGGFVIFRRPSPPRPIEYLLLKSSSKPYHWTPPKGHIDSGETAYVAALRETEEEAGILEKDIKQDPKWDPLPVTIDYETSTNELKRVHYYLGEVSNQQKVELSSEHTEYTWQPLEKALEISNFPPMIAVFKLAQERICKTNCCG